VVSSSSVNAAVSPGPEPLLRVDDLRLDVAGVPVCDGLTFVTKGDHVLVLGAPRALFLASAGLLPVVRGTLAIRGVPAAEAALRNLVAGVPADPPLPPRWSVLEYVRSSARLAGLSSDAARSRADDAIQKLELGALSKTKLARLTASARRATAVAAALATGADVIALEDPIGGLLEDATEGYSVVLQAAIADRATIVFAPRIPLTSALANAADDAIVATALRVEAQGTPAELASADRRFVVRVTGVFDPVATVLAERGARVETRGSHFIVDLGPNVGTSELMGICERENVAIVELAPAFRAFS
jgi:ABC-2 type transport system ATP-binding protein